MGKPCKEIHKNPELVYEYTFKGNMVAVITDVNAVSGLGNIGPEAGRQEATALAALEFGVAGLKLSIKT